MNISDPTFKEYSFANHSEVYKILEETFNEFNISYYLIGANARDVALYKAGERPIRATADIDFAVMVEDHQHYEAVKFRLSEKDFETSQERTPYRLYYNKSNTIIDLLPFGQIEQESTVSFDQRSVELSAVGMKEVLLAVETFEHPSGVSIPVSPAHGIVILKLIAWSEKPQRERDLSDIAALIKASWSLYEDELFIENSEHADLFNLPDDEFDIRLVAARVMGRKMQLILRDNYSLNESIQKMIKRDIEQHSGSISLSLAKTLGIDLILSKEHLKSILVGMTEKW